MTRRRWLIFAAGLVGVLILFAGVVYVVRVPDPFYRDPMPVRMLKRNRADIMKYFDSIHAGRIPLRADGRGYYVLNSFDGEVSTVESKDNCIVITFWFMPTDAVPQLVYSPRGFDGLPNFYKNADLFNPQHMNPDGLTYFHREKIDENWFYCRWDN